MTPGNGNESRMDRLERFLEAQSIEWTTRHREAMAEIQAQREAIEAQRESTESFKEFTRIHIESLHSSMNELHESSIKIQELLDRHDDRLQQDAEHIRALVRIAEIH